MGLKGNIFGYAAVAMILLFSNISQATTEIPKEVMVFLNNVQESVDTKLNQSEKKHGQLLSCFKENTHCQLIVGEDIKKEQVLNYISTAYQEFRFFVGYKHHQFLGQMRSTRARVRPIAGAPFLIFDDKGEKDAILAENQSFINLVKEETGDLSDRKEIKNVRKMMYQQRSDMYEALIDDFVRRFPFFIHLKTKTVTSQNLVKALEAFLSNLRKAKKIVAQLEGQKKLDLLGFSESVKEVMVFNSKAKNQHLLSFIENQKANNNFASQLWGFVSNPITLGIAGCFVTSSVLKPLALACSTIGMGRMTYLSIQSHIEMTNFKKLARTSLFDKDIYRSQLAFHMASVVMSVVFYQKALPGFANHSKQFKRNLKKTIVNIKKKNKIRMKNDFVKDSRELALSYSSYFSKDTVVFEAAGLGQTLANSIQGLAAFFGSSAVYASGSSVTAEDLVVARKSLGL